MYINMYGRVCVCGYHVSHIQVIYYIYIICICACANMFIYSYIYIYTCHGCVCVHVCVSVRALFVILVTLIGFFNTHTTCMHSIDLNRFICLLAYLLTSLSSIHRFSQLQPRD